MPAGKSYFSSDAPTLVLRSLFHKYDVDGSGYLEETELRELLEGDLGLNPDQRELYSLLLDKDGDNLVSFEEFVQWLRSGERFQNIDNSSRYAILCQAVEYFKTYDVSETHSLNQNEFKTLLRSLGCRQDDSVDKTFTAVDTHNNGKISFWEFLAWLKWLPL